MACQVICCISFEWSGKVLRMRGLKDRRLKWDSGRARKSGVKKPTRKLDGHPAPVRGTRRDVWTSPATLAPRASARLTTWPVYPPRKVIENAALLVFFLFLFFLDDRFGCCKNRYLLASKEISYQLDDPFLGHRILGKTICQIAARMECVPL